MYTYVPKNGDDFYPVSPGTQFRDLPEDWRCPTCGAEKSKFKNMGKEVAGFEANQGYGFGTNSMTGGEKSILMEDSPMGTRIPIQGALPTTTTTTTTWEGQTWRT